MPQKSQVELYAPNKRVHDEDESILVVFIAEMAQIKTSNTVKAKESRIHISDLGCRESILGLQIFAC